MGLGSGGVPSLFLFCDVAFVLNFSLLRELFGGVWNCTGAGWIVLYGVCVFRLLASAVS